MRPAAGDRGHGRPPGAGGEALAARALVSGHRGPRGLGQARTRTPCAPRPGRAREGAGRWAEVSSRAEVAGLGLQSGAGLPALNHPASPRLFFAAQQSAALGPRTADPVPDVRLRGALVVLPQAHRQGFPPSLPPLQFSSVQ